MNNKFIHQYISLNLHKLKIILMYLFISCNLTQIHASDNNTNGLHIAINQFFTSKKNFDRSQDEIGLEMKDLRPRIIVAVVVMREPQLNDNQQEATRLHQARLNEATRLHQARLNEAAQLHQARLNEAARLHQARLNEAAQLQQEATRLHQASLNEAALLYQERLQLKADQLMLRQGMSYQDAHKIIQNSNGMMTATHAGLFADH